MNWQPMNCYSQPDQLCFEQTTIADHHSLIAAVNNCPGNFYRPTLNPAPVQGGQNLNNNRASDSVVFGHKFLNNSQTTWYKVRGKLYAHLWQRANWVLISS